MGFFWWRGGACRCHHTRTKHIRSSELEQTFNLGSHRGIPRRAGGHDRRQTLILRAQTARTWWRHFIKTIKTYAASCLVSTRSARMTSHTLQRVSLGLVPDVAFLGQILALIGSLWPRKILCNACMWKSQSHQRLEQSKSRTISDA